MIADTLKIPGFDATLRLYLYDWSPNMKMQERPLILVCPGGGYSHLSVREGETMALQFMAMGYHSAVLSYSLAPVNYPVQFYEIGAAMKLLKEKSTEYHIIPDKIVVCGFSAGAHLAGMLGTGYNDNCLLKELKADIDYLKPAGMILSYPVITSGEYAHRGSFECLLGEKARDKDMLERVSLESCVDRSTVPTFMWHTFEDKTVPLENSLLFARALKKNNIPFEYHVFPTGCHGLALANEMTVSDDTNKELDEGSTQWIGLCRNWLKRLLG